MFDASEKTGSHWLVGVLNTLDLIPFKMYGWKMTMENRRAMPRTEKKSLICQSNEFPGGLGRGL